MRRGEGQGVRGRDPGARGPSGGRRARAQPPDPIPTPPVPSGVDSRPRRRPLESSLGRRAAPLVPWSPEPPPRVKPGASPCAGTTRFDPGGLLCRLRLVPPRSRGVGAGCDRLVRPVGLWVGGRRRSLWTLGRWPSLFRDIRRRAAARIRPPGRGGSPASSTWGAHVAAHRGPSRARRAPAADRSLGNSVGAIGSPHDHSGASAPGTVAGWGRRVRPSPATPLFGPALAARPRGRLGAPGDDSYLVDSASSHMLVSKIKPCMSKYKQTIR